MESRRENVPRYSGPSRLFLPALPFAQQRHCSTHTEEPHVHPPPIMAQHLSFHFALEVALCWAFQTAGGKEVSRSSTGKNSISGITKRHRPGIQSSKWKRRDKCKSLLWVCTPMENPCHVASWQLQVDLHAASPCQSVVFITCTRLFPLCPPSDIMGRSKVTHIYPIKRDFEKTNIGLQLMLQWGPESERCYRLKRLGFQSPANKRQSSPRREKETERMGAAGSGEGGAACGE